MITLRQPIYGQEKIDAGLVVKTSEHILLSVGFGMQIPKTYYEIKMGVGYRF